MMSTPREAFVVFTLGIMFASSLSYLLSVLFENTHAFRDTAILFGAGMFFVTVVVTLASLATRNWKDGE